MASKDNACASENTFLELISSLKSNKQILRRILRTNEVPTKKHKANSGNANHSKQASNYDDRSEETANGISQLEVVAFAGRGKDDVGNEDDDDEDNDDHGSDDGGDDESGNDTEADENEDGSDGNESDESEDSDDDNQDSDVDDEKEENSFNNDIEKQNSNLNQPSNDPFKIHFEQDLKEGTVNEIMKSKFEKQSTENIDNLMCEYFVYPERIALQLQNFTVDIKKDNNTKLFTSAAIKENLISNWKNLEKSKKVFLNDMHDDLFRKVASYKDVFHLNSSYEYWEKIRHLYVLHIVNHVLKARAKVAKNNTKLSEAENNQDLEDCRDQGLTRPKVLILVPFKNNCLEIVNDIIKLVSTSGSKLQVMQKKRFMQEFSPHPNEKESKLVRPDDYNAMFKGNIDDCFRIGLTIAKNTIKLFSPFYAADVIIASPLGLRTIIGSEGEKQDFDFLSSIEMLILDHADAFLMQNWEHVTHIFDYLNLIIRQSHDTDFSRVRMFTVNGWAKYYRQTMLFSSVQTPEINAIFNKFCYNYAGKAKYTCNNEYGSVGQIVSQIPQVYQRINCSAFLDIPDKRFEYFVNKILPDFKNNLFYGTAIFIPSYFDFVRVRNYFKKENLSFLQICEYSKRSNISRSRSMFLEKKKHFLLFTERFHFFFRYKLRGVKHIIFYQLPHYPNFYPEVINFMDSLQSIGSSSSVSCTVLYSRFDGYRLEAIVGNDRCKQMMVSVKDTHMVITES